MLVYPHPLDYVTGLKYTVTDKKLPFEFKLSPETFHVSEIVDLSKAGFSKEKSEYAVLRLWKKRLEMFKAIEIVSRKLNIPQSNIQFYGIKDKNACTESYLFVKSQLLDSRLLPVVTDNVKVELIGFIRSKPKRTYFNGNRFRIFIGVSGNDKSKSLLKEIIHTISEVGLPAYYGYQRFGWKRYNSHILGKYILLGREDLFAEEFLKDLYPREDFECTLKRYLKVYEDVLYESTYVKAPLNRGLRAVTAKVRNMFLDAYSSFLFNLLLNMIIERSGLSALATKLPMPGCSNESWYYEALMKVENIDLSLLSNLKCFHRNGLFRPVDSVLEYHNSHIVYEFSLKPGMYATVVLRELFKDNLLLENPPD